MEATFWAVVPPLVAIVLALITKEVYLSLLIGILSGAFLYTRFHVLTAVETTVGIMGEKISGNINIMLFLVLLGILVALITKSGASKAYGNWAVKSIKSRRGALLSTMALGILIFVDDYFNCLTVGTVMRPVTDRYHISRAKLAYIIDATAAPVCIIAPISSWAAAVGSSLPEGSHIDGFNLFLRTIPFNLYALLTMVFLFYIVIRDVDFSKMRQYEIKVAAEGEETTDDEHEEMAIGNGKVMDLILPIALLIVLCISAMLYTGGILQGVPVVEAFSNCDASLSLVLGSFFTLVVTFFFYMFRKVLSFRAFCDCFVQGFKAMTASMMILSLAWTLSGICGEEYLNIGGFVSGLVEGSGGILILMPCIMFLVAVGLSFSTGTSWGTFGILIPIGVAVVGSQDISMLSLVVAAILSGAVCGDHISPISDTTILSSAGAQCNHINHVSTQIPYALVVTGCSFVGYLIGGLCKNGWVSLGVGMICVVGVMLFLRKTVEEKAQFRKICR